VALSIFDDKSSVPTTEALERALGRSRDAWNDLKNRIGAEHAPITEEWVFSGKNYGWSLRLKKKKRAVIYLTPEKGCFQVGLALGERAVRAAHESDLPAAMLQQIDSAPRYVEGRGIRIEVRGRDDVEIIVRIVAVKMAH
jgi:hypothetical protein